MEYKEIKESPKYLLDFDYKSENFYDIATVVAIGKDNEMIQVMLLYDHYPAGEAGTKLWVRPEQLKEPK